MTEGGAVAGTDGGGIMGVGARDGVAEADAVIVVARFVDVGATVFRLRPRVGVDSGSGVGVAVGVPSNCTPPRRASAFFASSDAADFRPRGARVTGADTEAAAPAVPRWTSMSCKAMSTSKPLPFFLPIPRRLRLFGAICDTTLRKSMNLCLCR